MFYREFYKLVSFSLREIVYDSDNVIYKFAYTRIIIKPLRSDADEFSGSDELIPWVKYVMKQLVCNLLTENICF